MAEKGVLHPQVIKGNLRPFKKGDLTNPVGRPKELVALRKQIREQGEKLILALMETALDPDRRDHVKACQVLLDYGYGKPMQSIEVTPVTIDPSEAAERAVDALLNNPAMRERLRLKLAAISPEESEQSGGGGEE